MLLHKKNALNSRSYCPVEWLHIYMACATQLSRKHHCQLHPAAQDPRLVCGNYLDRLLRGVHAPPYQQWRRQPPDEPSYYLVPASKPDL